MTFTIFNKGLLPIEWVEAYITCVFKTRDRPRCENYRNISVSSAKRRLVDKVFNRKLEKGTEK